MDDFYDELAPLYHLIYEDWPASVRRQGERLAAVIRAHWPPPSGAAPRWLDAACGIGTQSIGLALQGFRVQGCDLSAGAVRRAAQEAQAWGVPLALSVADLRTLHAQVGGGFDGVLCADNSLPHLQTEAELDTALAQMHACLRPGGACVISVRDYAQEPRGRHQVKPYGVRVQDGQRHLLFQVWDFDDGPHYDLRLFIVSEDLQTGAVQTRCLRSRYHAVSIERLLALMRAVGFTAVQRLDGAFHQPLLLGTR